MVRGQAPSEGPGQPRDRLRETAIRLAGELEAGRHYQAAAYASMAADVIRRTQDGTIAEYPRTDVELEFELDEHGRVWMIREGDCHIIGRRDAVRLEMWRFLAGTALRGR